MLNAASQSSGLTLVAATHVLLVEPSLNPASEQQAIHRVHRIGQTRPTTVHRFYIADTVEEGILGLQRTGPHAASDGEEEDDEDAENEDAEDATGTVTSRGGMVGPVSQP
jgi:E3 ubiquitin-protein ligase SHPRH